MVHSNLAAFSKEPNVRVLAQQFKRFDLNLWITAVSHLDQLVRDERTGLLNVCECLEVERLDEY